MIKVLKITHSLELLNKGEVNEDKEGHGNYIDINGRPFTVSGAGGKRDGNKNSHVVFMHKNV